MPRPPIAPDQTSFVSAEGIRFYYERYDPPAGADAALRPILLIHGFPQTHYCWRLVAGPLAAATGRTVYAIDTKGNGASDKPRPDRRTPAGRYDLTRLTSELHALVEALDIAPAVVVGHDWGGVLAFVLAAFYPDVVERLVLIDGPSLLPRNPLRIWYVALFQIPRLPEWFFRRGGVRLLLMGLRTMSGRAIFTRRDAAVYTAPLVAPGGIEAALAYYRRALPDIRIEARRRGIHMPTLLLWGDHDPALPLDVPRRMVREIPGSALAILAHTGHWVPEERPADVVRLIQDFLASAPPAGRGRLVWTVP
jgi:pimeloyl-ACP methyl ester carboxylesterase